MLYIGFRAFSVCAHMGMGASAKEFFLSSLQELWDGEHGNGISWHSMAWRAWCWFTRGTRFRVLLVMRNEIPEVLAVGNSALLCRLPSLMHARRPLACMQFGGSCLIHHPHTVYDCLG